MEPEEFIGEIKKTFSRAFALLDWMQQILLEDINAAIENRIRTMELIIQVKYAQSRRKIWMRNNRPLEFCGATIKQTSKAKSLNTLSGCKKKDMPKQQSHAAYVS